MQDASCLLVVMNSLNFMLAENFTMKSSCRSLGFYLNNNFPFLKFIFKDHELYRPIYLTFCLKVFNLIHTKKRGGVAIL